MPFNKSTYEENYRKTGKKRGEKRVTSCLVCSREIIDYASQSLRVTCSRECKWEKDRTEIKHSCDFCGKDVTVTPSRVKWSKIRGNGKIFCDKDCQRFGNSGENSHFWIDDRSKIKSPRAARTMEYKEWRKAVFERDSYTCQKCGTVGGYLHAHHIKEWQYYPELRYDVDNGQTLCRRPCHKEVHAARRSNRKITNAQIEEIKAKRIGGATLRSIGKEYGLSESRVCTICTGKKEILPYNVA
jgi:HNH endonuclease